MLELNDCIALCGLTEEEILEIGRHENLTEIVAAELGNYLLRTPGGERRIGQMIKDDLEAAIASGHRDRVLALKLVLQKFIGRHPRCNDSV